MAAAKAQAEKDKGNAAFKANDFPTAIGHYSAAILADPSNPTYPLNRAAAYIKLGKNEDAERDCSNVLRLDAENVKGLFRRGQARVALQRLSEARDDFQKALALDPANDAAKAELKKVEEALKAQSKPRKHPVDISSSTPPSPSASEPHPKRRRIPIEIVEDPSSPSAPAPASKSSSRTDDLLTPVSSRPISTNVGTPSPSPPSKPSQKSFQEAKQARTASRPGGGIFRPNGQHTIFGEKKSAEGSPASASSPLAAPVLGSETTEAEAASGTGTAKTDTGPVASTTSTSTPGPVSLPQTSAQQPRESRQQHAPVTKSPVTLFAFSKRWEKARTAEDRWALLCEIPAASLPSLFQSSLEPSVLAAMLTTFRDVLAAHGAAQPALQAHVRTYMEGLARVPRFGTVRLFLSADEAAVGREVWAAVGGGLKGAWA